MRSNTLAWRVSPLAAFGIAFALVMAMSLAYGGLHGYDGYFHMRAAAMYLTGEIPDAGESFHWTLHSVWNGSYSDKDFLFHIFLTPLVLVFGDTTEGLVRAGVVATGIMSGLLAMTAFVVMRARGVRWPLLWIVLLVGISETFIFRQILCRSYLLSVTYALLGFHLLVSGRVKALAVVAALYALSYTAPHLLLGMAVLWGLVCLKWRGFERFGVVRAGDAGTREMLGEDGGWFRAALRAFVPAGWVVFGLTVGWLLHPHPMNLATSWLLQNVAVPLHSLGLHGAADWIAALGGYATDATLVVDDLGTEMAETTGRELMGRHLLSCLAFVVPWMLAALVGVRLKREDLFVWALAGVFFAMTLSHERFTEYFAPFVVLAAAMMLARIAESLESSGWMARHRDMVKWVVVTLAVAAVVHLPLRCWALVGTIEESPMRPSAMQPVAELVKARIPAGSAVFHAGWDAFPQLFFFAPEYRYVVGLDPTFLAAKSPELYRRIREIGKGEPSLAWNGRSAAEVIRDEFGMEFALVDVKKQEGFATLMGRSELAGDVTLLGRTKGDGWRLYWLKPLKETLGAGPVKK